MAEHIRTTKTDFGKRSSGIRKQVFDLDPRRGLDLGASFDRVDPGFSPAVTNFEPNDRGIRPRSGVSGFYEDTKSAVTVDGSMFKGFTASNVRGTEFAYFVNKHGSPSKANVRGLWFISGDGPDWKNPQGSLTWASTNSYAVYDATYIYDPGRAENIGVVTNGEDPPFYFNVGLDDPFALSSFTDTTLLTRASTCAAVDERLVFANVAGPDGTFGNRVLWTVRGNPRNFALASGAGYQDITDARGPFVKIIADQEGMVLWSRTEIWRARPRRDNFAFDFYRLSPDLGLLNPYTVVTSPFGVLFVGSDYEVYSLLGNRLKAISRHSEQPHSRVRSELLASPEPRRMYGVYHPEEKRYYLFYRGGNLQNSDSDDFPKQCLMYDFQTDSWWFWNLPHAVHSAVAFQQRWDFASQYRWDDFPLTNWEDMDDIWDQTGLDRNDRNILCMWADGQTFRFSPDAPADSNISTVGSSEIACTWYSHGHHMPGFLTFYNRLEEAWIEYQQPGTSNASSRLTITTHRTRAEQLRNTGPVPSGVSFIHVGIDDTDRTPQFQLDFASHESSGTPTLIRMQTLLSNDGKYQGNR